MSSTTNRLDAANTDIAFSRESRILLLLLATLALLLQPAAALADGYTSGGFVVLAPQMTDFYLGSHPEATVVVNNFTLENGEKVTVVLDRTLPDRLLTSGVNSMYDFPDFINFEIKERKLPCLDSSKDIYALMHGRGELGREFQFAKFHRKLIEGTAEDLARILAAVNEKLPGVLKPGSNVGVTSCYFESRLVRMTKTCGPHYVNTSTAIKLQRELMENSALKEFNSKVISLSSDGRVHYPAGKKGIGDLLKAGAVCEQRFEVRLFEEIVDETKLPYVTASGERKKTHLRPITVKEVSSELVEAVEQGMAPKDAYKEIYIKDRAVITLKNLKSLESVGTELAEYVTKKRRFAGFTPVQINPPAGPKLATKIFVKGMLFIDAAMSLWEIGKVTYHSVVFYNEHTGAVEGIARAAVMEDKWRSDIAGQIEDVKQLQYQEDAKWALSMLNYLLAVQAEKEELFAYWEKEGIPREQFLDTHKLVNLNQKIINTLYKMRGTESYAAIDPGLRSTAWKINVNPLLPGGTYYDPSWQPQPRPNLEELILIPDVREELLRIISDLDCDRAKRFLGGKTSDELGHADLIALLGFIGSQAYQELVDAAALVQKPKTEFLDSTTKGWGFERKRTIENENRGSDERVYFNPAVWIGVSGPGKLGEEYFSFLP